jgi:lysophospholipase L1-like esterase
VSSLPYLVPGLERYRPWTSADGLPFSGLFKTDSAGPMVAEASGGESQRNAVTKREHNLLTLLENHPAVVGAGPLLAHRSEDPQTTPKIEIPEEVYRDVKVRIEDPRKTMKAFYRALARTARRERGAVTRISHWGDSATAPDKITAVTRALMQKQFGDAGHGFILAAPPTKWYWHAGVVRRHANWKVRRITHRNSRDGRYGLGGVRAVGTGSEEAPASSYFANLRSRKTGRATSRFDVYYLKGPGQGKLALRVDHKRPKVFSAAAKRWEDAVHSVQVPDGPHRFKVEARGDRPVSVYGVVMERDGPGVVYDNLGLTGYFASRVVNASPKHFKKQLEFRSPDLMVLMFGGNTLGFAHWTTKRFRRQFSAVVKLFRESRPEAPCLVLSPLDHGERVRGKVRTDPRLKDMIAIQREAALAGGCAFYSIFDAMGGEGTMGRWATSTPRLVISDLSHVTRDGARVIGSLIYKALVTGLVDYLRGAAPTHGDDA